MDPATTATVLAAASPLLVTLFTWITRRGLDRRSAEAEIRATEAKTMEERLTQQREDFRALVDPLQESVTTLRGQNKDLTERVSTLEDRAESAERLVRRLVRSLEKILAYLHRKYQDPGPPLAPEVEKLVERPRTWQKE